MLSKYEVFALIDEATTEAIHTDEWKPQRDELVQIVQKFYEEHFAEKRPRWALAYAIARLMLIFAGFDWHTSNDETKTKGAVA